MDEKSLVQLSQTGDKDAFAALYGMYKDRLYRYAYYRLENPDDAEDAVQDCVLAAYIQISSLKKAEAFSGWVFRILACVCNAKIKQQILVKKNRSIDDMAYELAAPAHECTIERTDLQSALSRLKEDEREVVLLSVVAGCTSKEIAKITDMTAGAVRSKLSRSLKKMKDFLGDSYEG